MGPKDFGDIKRMLYAEFMEQEPSDDMQTGFLTGMAWLEQALMEEDDTIEDLYDYLPLRVKYKNLKEQLKIVQGITERCEKAERDYQGMKNKLENMLHMSDKEKKEIKKEEKYKEINKEMKKLLLYKDLYYCLVVERYKKEILNKQDIE